MDPSNNNNKRSNTTDAKTDDDREQKRQRLTGEYEEEKTRAIEQADRFVQDEDEDITELDRQFVRTLRQNFLNEHISSLTMPVERVIHNYGIMRNISSYLLFVERPVLFQLASRINSMYELTQQNKQYIKQEPEPEEEELKLIDFDLSIDHESDDDDEPIIFLGKFKEVPLRYAPLIVTYTTHIWEYYNPPNLHQISEDKKAWMYNTYSSMIVIPNPTEENNDQMRAIEVDSDLLDANHNRFDGVFDDMPKSWQRINRRMKVNAITSIQPSGVLRSMVNLERLGIDFRMEQFEDSKTMVYGRARDPSEVPSMQANRHLYYQLRSSPDTNRVSNLDGSRSMDYSNRSAPVLPERDKYTRTFENLRDLTQTIDIQPMICMRKVEELINNVNMHPIARLDLYELISPGILLEWDFPIPDTVHMLWIELDTDTYDDYEEIDEKDGVNPRPIDPWVKHEDRIIHYAYPLYAMRDQRIEENKHDESAQRKKIWENIQELFITTGRVPISIQHSLASDKRNHRDNAWVEAFIHLLKNVPKLEHFEFVDNTLSTTLFDVFSVSPNIAFPFMKQVSIKTSKLGLDTVSRVFTQTRSLKLTMSINEFLGSRCSVRMPFLKYITLVLTGWTRDGAIAHHPNTITKILPTLLGFGNKMMPRLKLIRIGIAYDVNGPNQLNGYSTTHISSDEFVRGQVALALFEFDPRRLSAYITPKPDGFEVHDSDDNGTNHGLTFEHPMWSMYAPYEEDDVDDDFETDVYTFADQQQQDHDSDEETVAY